VKYVRCFTLFNDNFVLKKKIILCSKNVLKNALARVLNLQFRSIKLSFQSFFMVDSVTF